jgi:hypothetical protein
MLFVHCYGTCWNQVVVARILCNITTMGIAETDWMMRAVLPEGLLGIPLVCDAHCPMT